MASGVRDEVISGFADSLFISSWADAVERLVEEGELDRTPWGHGGAVDDHAPSTPASVHATAKREIARMERANGFGIEKAYKEAKRSQYDAPKDPSQFGWQLGLRWLGQGSAFPSDLEFETDHGEFMVDLPNPDDLNETEIGYESGAGVNGLEGLDGGRGDKRIKKVDKYEWRHVNPAFDRFRIYAIPGPGKYGVEDRETGAATSVHDQYEAAEWIEAMAADKPLSGVGTTDKKIIPIANENDYEWTRNAFLFQFGAFGTQVYVFANDLDDGLEIAGEWLKDNAPGIFVEEPENEEEEQDLTYTESGWLASWEWWVNELDKKEYEALKRRAYGANAMNGTR